MSIYFIGEASETHPERLSIQLKVTQGKGGARAVVASNFSFLICKQE